jgi:hypothetical protein
MRKPTLWRHADQFRARLTAIKNGICLLGGEWYPYDSMSSVVQLDQLLEGEVEALRLLAGSDPVLDVGCGDGDIAFFLESLGCREILALDHPPTNYNRMAGVSTMRRALASSIDIRAANLDYPFDLPHPRYGLAFLLGILYHLKNPYLILESLARKSRYCFLSTRIATLSPDRKTNLADLPVAYLLGEAEANDDSTNYWIFSEAGLRRILARAGWTVRNWRVTGNTSASDPVSPEGDARAFCLLESRLADRSTTFRLLEGWHDLEFNSWRWTGRRFSVELSAPLPNPTAPNPAEPNVAGINLAGADLAGTDLAGAKQAGANQDATLRFRFHLPPQLAALQPSVTLIAAINREALPPQTYSGAGDHRYVRNIAASVLSEHPIQLTFELDRALGPSELDQRELGLLVDFSGAPPIVLE